jgi:hypothetical protein
MLNNHFALEIDDTEADEHSPSMLRSVDLSLYGIGMLARH